jgi:cytoskeleton protein RodZ
MKVSSRRRIIDLTDDHIDVDMGPIEQTNGSVDPVEPPLDVAQVLHQARVRRRISLARASDETKISRDYLQALETHVSIDRFPAPVYARFFLTDYARFLGLEPEPLLRSFDGHAPTLEPLIGEPIRERLVRTHRWTGRILIAASAAVVLGLVVGHVRSDSSTPVASTSSSVSGTSAAAAGSKLAHEPAWSRPRPALHGVHLRIAVSATCWTRAVSDGTVTLQQLLPAGRTVTLRAKRTLDLTLGNAGGVRLRVNNRPVATGAPGQVIHIQFLWRNGHVVTKR